MRRALAISAIFCILLLSACSLRSVQPVLPRGQTIGQLHLEQLAADRHICAWIPYFTVTELCKGGTEESCRQAVSEYLTRAEAYGLTDLFVHVCAFGEAFYPSDYYPPAPEADGLDVMQIFTEE